MSNTFQRWAVWSVLILPFGACLYSPSAALAGPVRSADGFAILAACGESPSVTA
jgi:hypothetical protein